MQDILSNLESKRWAWMEKGVKEFREGFYRLEEGRKEHKSLIGVYGPTQVGKTTFILTMLGIKPEKMKALAKALRGDQVQGKSATITSTIFKRSLNNSFIIVHPSGFRYRYDTLIGLEKGMSELRKVIEKSAEHSIQPIVIQLPEFLFSSQILEAQKQIEILDLPGDDSKNEKERKHVERCLKYYLPLCRVCVIMEIASQLVSLTQIERDFVRDWPLMPARFRIVLTRAASSSSMKKQIKENRIDGVETFKEYFTNEILRTLKKETLIQVYPLEFGDSWDHLCKEEQALYNKADPLIKEVFQDLVENLASTYSPYNEVEQARYLEEYIVNKSKAEYENLENKKVQVQQEIKIQEQKKMYAAGHSMLIQEKINKVEDAKIAVKNVDTLEFEIPHLIEWENRSKKERTKKALLADYDFYLNIIEKKFEDEVRLLNKKFRIFSYKYKTDHKEVDFEFKFKNFVSLDNLVSGLFFSEEKFNILKEAIEKELEQSRLENQEALRYSLRKAQEQVMRELKQKVRLLELEQTKKKEEKIKIEEKIRELGTKISNIEKQSMVLIKEWEKDVERSKHLDLFLKKAFNEQTELFKKVIGSKHTSASEKWANHQYWAMMKQDAERLIPIEPN